MIINNCRIKWKIVLIAATAAIVIGVAAYFITKAVTADKDGGLNPPNPTEDPPPSSSVMGNFREAAVVTNGYLCADIGKDVLLEGGTAVDATIATLFCEGVMCLQSMGIGGGFLMTIYQRSTKTAQVLNARETAPAGATENMFHGDPNLSQKGGLSIAIPAELRGYWAAHQKYGGNVTWERLIRPTVKICREGFAVPAYLADYLKKYEADILADPGLSQILVNPKTHKVLSKGDMLKRPKLADTLEVIAREGVDAFYNGSLTKNILADIQQAGGIITADDLRNFDIEWQAPVEANIGEYKMFSVPLPGSGVLLSFILNILDGFVPASDDGVTYHRITEAFKYGFGKRTELGDISQDEFVPNITYVKELINNLTSPKYAQEIRQRIQDYKTYQDPSYYGAVLAVPDDHGTAHVSVLAPNGDAVSVTSTVNLILGSRVRSMSTGIIFNDEMDDFSAPNITNAFGVPPSPANFIRPGKRPLSSMCPAIFIDENGDVQLVTGAAGGTKITTATALSAIFNLVFKKNIKETIDTRRFHHQLFPMEFEYEFGFLQQNVEKLTKIGHKTTRAMTAGSGITGIAKLRGNVTACYDFRRGGAVAGF